MNNRLGVGSAGRARLPASREGIAPEERVEQVAESEGIAARLPTGSRSRSVFAKDVVAPAALGVAQRLVRDADLLEARLGVGVVGIVVGVIAPRECAVRALDLVVGRSARDPEHFVVVTHDKTRPSCCEMASTAASAWR